PWLTIGVDRGTGERRAGPDSPEIYRGCRRAPDTPAPRISSVRWPTRLGCNRSAQRYQRRAELHSVPDLIASLQEYLDSHNDAPRPYVWTATAESILAKVARGRIALEKVS